MDEAYAVCAGRVQRKVNRFAVVTLPGDDLESLVISERENLMGRLAAGPESGICVRGKRIAGMELLTGIGYLGRVKGFREFRERACPEAPN